MEEGTLSQRDQAEEKIPVAIIGGTRQHRPAMLEVSEKTEGYEAPGPLVEDLGGFFL